MWQPRQEGEGVWEKGLKLYLARLSWEAARSRAVALSGGPTLSAPSSLNHTQLSALHAQHMFLIPFPLMYNRWRICFQPQSIGMSCQFGQSTVNSTSMVQCNTLWMLKFNAQTPCSKHGACLYNTYLLCYVKIITSFLFNC